MNKTLHLATIVVQIVSSAGLAAAFFLTALNDFDEVGYTNRSALYAVLQGSVLAFTLAGGVVLILMKPTVKYEASYNLFFYTHWFVAVATVVFLFLRLVNMGLLDPLMKDFGCKDPDVMGDPFERFLRYGDESITDVSQCVFNAFNQETIVSSATNPEVIKLNWADPNTYKAANRQTMIDAANDVSQSAWSNNTLPYYHESWYWGCSAVCTKERYDLNHLWLYLTCAALFVQVASAVMVQLMLANLAPESTDQELKPLIQTSKDDVSSIEAPDAPDSPPTLRL